MITEAHRKKIRGLTTLLNRLRPQERAVIQKLLHIVRDEAKDEGWDAGWAARASLLPKPRTK